MKRIFVLFSVIFLVLVGCSKNEVVNENIDYENREEVVIKYRYWCDKKENSQIMLNIIEKFNETNNKKIRVVGEEVPLDDSYYDGLLLSAKENNDVDVASIDMLSMKHFMDEKLITNLNPYIKSWSEKKDINDNVYKIIEKKSGKKNFFSMPWYASTWYVYFRPSYFEQCNVQVPQSFDDFLECCKNSCLDLNNDDISDLQSISFAGINDLVKICSSFLASENGSFEKISSEKSIKGMEKFLDFCKSSYVFPSCMSDGDSETLTSLKNGLLSMAILKHGYAMELIQSLNNDISAFPLPKGKNQWTYMDSVENVIFENCQHKQDAFEWISYLATGEGQRMWCEGTGNIPISKKLSIDENFQSDIFTKTAVESLNFAGSIDGMKNNDFNDAFNSIITLAINDNLSAKEVCNKLKTELFK